MIFFCPTGPSLLQESHYPHLEGDTTRILSVRIAHTQEEATEEEEGDLQQHILRVVDSTEGMESDIRVYIYHYMYNDICHYMYNGG